MRFLPVPPCRAPVPCCPERVSDGLRRSSPRWRRRSARTGSSRRRIALDCHSLAVTCVMHLHRISSQSSSLRYAGRLGGGGVWSSLLRGPQAAAAQIPCVACRCRADTVSHDNLLWRSPPSGPAVTLRHHGVRAAASCPTSSPSPYRASQPRYWTGLGGGGALSAA